MILSTVHPSSAYFAPSTDTWVDSEDYASPTWLASGAGTGGNRSVYIVASSLGATFYTYLGALISDDSTDARPVFSFDVPESLAELRQSFGLSTVDLARVLRVSRQAIYDWTSGKPVKPEHRQRLRDLRDLANAWRDTPAGPLGELLHERVGGQPTLLDQLSLDTLDLPALRARLDTLSALHRQALAARPPSADELASRFSLRPLSAQTQRRTLRTVSGSRRG